MWFLECVGSFGARQEVLVRVRYLKWSLLTEQGAVISEDQVSGVSII